MNIPVRTICEQIRTALSINKTKHNIGDILYSYFINDKWYEVFEITKIDGDDLTVKVIGMYHKKAGYLNVQEEYEEFNTNGPFYKECVTTIKPF